MYARRTVDVSAVFKVNALQTRYRAVCINNGEMTLVWASKELKIDPGAIKSTMALICNKETLEGHKNRGKQVQSAWCDRSIMGHSTTNRP